MRNILKKRLPLILLLMLALAGFFALGDWLSPRTLALHRATLQEWRQAAPLVLALGFVTLYVAIVAASFPGPRSCR